MVGEQHGDRTRCRPLVAPAVCPGFHACVNMDGMQFFVRTIFGGLNGQLFFFSKKHVNKCRENFDPNEIHILIMIWS